MPGAKRELLIIENGVDENDSDYECYRVMARPTPGLSNPAVPQVKGQEVEDSSFYAYTLRYTPRLDKILKEPTKWLVSTAYNPSRRNARSTLKTFDLRDDRRHVDVMFE